MLKKHSRSVGLVLASVLAGAAVAGCGPSDGPEAQPSSSEGVEQPTESDELTISTLTDGFIRTDDGGEAEDGGILRWAAYSEPSSLDPATTIFAGTTGGIEMANLYDTIAKWDSDAGEVLPHLAEKIEPNETFDQWTVTLREGVTFSNGEEYDAAAVKASQERYVEESGPESAIWSSRVVDIRPEDSHTLTYVLSAPWRTFPAILSTGPGLIVAPSSYEGENFEPIGAGPFVLDEWTAGEQISFTAREDYWQGAPHLEGFISVFLDDQQISIDTLQSGNIEGAFVFDPPYVQQVLDGGYNGYVAKVASGSVALLNASPEAPTSDIRVRKAIQLAVDPEVIAARAFEGAVEGLSSIFPADSVWSTETQAPAPDLDEAKALLESAMADGYDGKLEYIDSTDTTSRNRALAVQAQLEAAGFDVELTLTRTIGERIQRIIVDGDYHMSQWGINLRGNDPLPKLYAAMHSEGNQTYSMFTSPQMDAHIEEFWEAADEDQARAAMEKIQQQMNEDVPFVTWAEYAEIFTWAPNVHGIEGGSNSTVLFNSAWIGG